MAEVFGFDEAIADMDRYERNADGVEDVLREMGEVMRDAARNNARGAGLYRTGAGVSGIEMQDQGDAVVIGWGPRPYFHLYFHELGFLARDNRMKWLPVGARPGTWISASPHMRPAFDQHEHEFLQKIQNKLME